MTAPVFVVDDFDTGGTGRYVLGGPEGRHAVAVKRLRAARRSSSPTAPAAGPPARWRAPRARTG